MKRRMRWAGRMSAGLVVAAATAAAHGQDLAQARVFVLDLYHAYEQRDPDYLGADAPGVFTPALLTLIQDEVARSAPGDASVVDADPICDCQDANGLIRVEVDVVEQGASMARAEVRFRLAGQGRRVSLDLQDTPAGWRVRDVHTPSVPSLADALHAAQAATP